VHYAALIDNKDRSKPQLISLFPVPRPPKEAPYKDFCDKGGRFGPHNVSQEIHSPDVQKPGNMIYIAYFNAGLRAFDISDPHLPTEMSWFIPPERPDAPKFSGPMSRRSTGLKMSLWTLAATFTSPTTNGASGS
jgi:LVIVD repeat